ncbi:MAG: hypothetical protein ABSC24_02120 [Verrucomicrobiota bacterium]
MSYLTNKPEPLGLGKAIGLAALEILQLLSNSGFSDTGSPRRAGIHPIFQCAQPMF